MNIAITAIGTAVPAYRGAQQQVVDFMTEALQLTPSTKRRIKKLYEGTGIDYRHSVLSDFQKKIGQFEFFPNNRADPFPSTAARMSIYKQNALSLAIEAIENCLVMHKDFNREEITHLITVSCTGMYAPGIDIQIIEKLNLSTSIQRTAINFMGCYGAFNAIKVAHAICQGNASAKVLVVSVELCTIHFQKNNSIENLISSAIFSDGAGAALIEANPTSKKYFNLDKFYCDLLPQSSDEMAWHIGDHGFDMVLSAYVPQCIESGIKNFADKLLQQKNFNIADIDHFAIHPGGFKILEACEQSLQISSNDNRYSYQILRDYGNMSSATILFVLKAIWNDMQLENDQDHIFSCAFGPGLTLESMLLRVHHV